MLGHPLKTSYSVIFTAVGNSDVSNEEQNSNAFDFTVSNIESGGNEKLTRLEHSQNA